MPVPDLFADSTMSFGDHLEALRSHLFRCVVYLLVACAPAAYFAQDVLDLVTAPIAAALEDYDPDAARELNEKSETAGESFLDNLRNMWRGDVAEEVVDAADGDDSDFDAAPPPEVLEALVRRDDLRRAAGLAPLGGDAGKTAVPLRLSSEFFEKARRSAAASRGLVTHDLMSPFVIYIKAILVTAFAAVSPLIFVELWLFVGAGLYPHERKYVYLYMPISLGLFFAGAAFCFTVVFQFVLPFLLSFNDLIGTIPLIGADTWFSFALFLPGMFGLSFQLPLVMLALNRLGLVEASFYRENKRMAILVISFLSVILTPSDPGSMLAMMIPLVGLYFAGIWMCDHFPTPAARNPFDDEPQKKRFAD